MALELLSLYNEITGQAWSMFDSEVESKEDFESSVRIAIQQALSYLWNVYDFSFKIKDYSFTTSENNARYSAPLGKIIKKKVNGKEVNSIKLDNQYLEYEPNYKDLEFKRGKPSKFYVKDDYLFVYPVPDKDYQIDIEYSLMFPAMDSMDEVKATLEDDTDRVNIPERYETFFKNALLPKAMMYAIADKETNENYSQYMDKYIEAFNILVEYTDGVQIDKLIGW